MVKVYQQLAHLNGNLLAAIDLETTGLRAGFHEPIQIAVVPLTADIKPMEGVKPFYHYIKPLHPERAQKGSTHTHGLSLEELVIHAPEPDRVEDWLVEWWENLDLPIGRTLVPLAHNWAFESSFLKAWLGVDLASKLFHGHARDAMIDASFINDRAAFAGDDPPFRWLGLGPMCNYFNVHNTHPHDALADAIAEAEVYRRMLITEFDLG